MDRTRKSWCMMKCRCSDYWVRENYSSVTVCSRWDIFENFLLDMGERPPNTTLDRINNNGNYEPGNCRWATVSVQNFNTGLRSDSTTGITGVYWIDKRRRWCAKICKDKRQIYLGFYKMFNDAIIARREGELKYYGFTK